MAVVSGRPQYDYSRPSGGLPISSGGGRPSGGSRPSGGIRPSGGGRPSGGRPSSSYVPSGGIDGGDQSTLIQKHVYLHVPPPELEEAPAPSRTISAGRKEKHYKIIFVKAPVPAQPAAPIIPASPGKEEKTIVYVLVKKPEDGPDITIPTPAPTEPVKPEVYFIRYKAKKEGGGEGGAEEGYGDGRPIGGSVGPGGSSGGTGSASYLPPRSS